MWYIVPHLLLFLTTVWRSQAPAAPASFGWAQGIADSAQAVEHMTSALARLPRNWYAVNDYNHYNGGKFSILNAIRAQAKDPAAITTWHKAWGSGARALRAQCKMVDEPGDDLVSYCVYGGRSGRNQWVCYGQPTFSHPKVQLEGQDYQDASPRQQAALRAAQWSKQHVEVRTKGQHAAQAARIERSALGAKGYGGGYASSQETWLPRKIHRCRGDRHRAGQHRVDKRVSDDAPEERMPKRPKFDAESVAAYKYETNSNVSAVRKHLAALKGGLSKEDSVMVATAAQMTAHLDHKELPEFTLDAVTGSVAVNVGAVVKQGCTATDLQPLLKATVEAYDGRIVLFYTADGFEVANGTNCTMACLQWQNLGTVRTNPYAIIPVFLQMASESLALMQKMRKVNLHGIGDTVTFQCPGNNCFLRGKGYGGPCGGNHTLPLDIVDVHDGKSVNLQNAMKSSCCVLCGQNIRGLPLDPAGVKAIAPAEDLGALSLKQMQAKVLVLRKRDGVPPPNRTARWSRKDVEAELRQRQSAVASEPAEAEELPPAAQVDATVSPAVNVARDILVPSNIAYALAFAEHAAAGGTASDFLTSTPGLAWQESFPTQKGLAAEPSSNVMSCNLHRKLSEVHDVLTVVIMGEVASLCAAGFPGIFMFAQGLSMAGVPWAAQRFLKAMEEVAPALLVSEKKGGKRTSSSKHNTKLAQHYVSKMNGDSLRREHADLVASGLAKKGAMLVGELREAVVAALAQGMASGNICPHVIAVAASKNVDRWNPYVVEQMRLRSIEADGASVEIESIDQKVLKEAGANAIKAFMGKSCSGFIDGAWKLMVQSMNTNNIPEGVLLSTLKATMGALSSEERRLIRQHAALLESASANRAAQAELGESEAAELTEALATVSDSLLSVQEEAAKAGRDKAKLSEQKPLCRWSQKMFDTIQMFVSFAQPLASGRQEEQLSGQEHKKRARAFLKQMEDSYAVCWFTKHYWHEETEHVPLQIDMLKTKYKGTTTVATYTTQGPEHVNKMVKERLRYLLGILKMKKAEMKKADPLLMIMKDRLLHLLHYGRTIPKKGASRCSVCKRLGHNKNNETLCPGPPANTN